ncbi:unnamed protein product [Rangifer tarandus platyrhynchus]|uniref:Uncharacterized protein n=1 Tax=Rangifer tarandus platyrhynchus TaxID=3082113 RepID=A0AC60A194_RANTA
MWTVALGELVPTGYPQWNLYPHNSYKRGAEGCSPRGSFRHLTRRRVAGAGRAEELCTAARCAAVGTRGRISRRPGRNRLPEAGEGLGSRPGCEPGGRAGERESKELSGAGGRAPVRREHVQFAPHPYYGDKWKPPAQ